MSNPGEDVVGRIFQQTDQSFRGPMAGRNLAHGWKGRKGPVAGARWREREQQMRSRRWEHLVTQIKGTSFDSELEAKTGCSKIQTMDLSLKFSASVVTCRVLVDFSIKYS